MRFNLNWLSPLEFENLSRDIISKKLNLEFKRFKSGKDGGIDLRNKDNGIVCQCKHIRKFSDLKSSLKKEVSKLAEIKDMKKYYLIVSTDLSPANEDEIMEIFGKYITSSEQIISYNEIEQFLEDDENIDILKKNTKLWLTSSKILEIINQKYVDFNVDSLMSYISSNISHFVETDVFRKGYDKLISERLIIISGSPGVGKTINSYMLISKLIATNPELKVKTINGSNYQELINSFHKDDYEVIILDDFLGQSYLEKSDAEIREIILIIEYVRRNSKKYLIINSRLSVLSEAKDVNEKLSNLLIELENSNYLIDMNNISLLEKAEILFNLHYFKKVPSDYFEELKKTEIFEPRYETIINNRNYNTRIIEYCVLNYKKDKISCENYFGYIMENLYNPQAVWKNQFKHFKREEISYLHVMYSLGTSNISRDILKECFEKVIKNRKYDTEFNSFNNITSKLSDSIITQKVSNNKYFINVINPSVNDYIMNDLEDNVTELEKMIDECIYIEQFLNIVNLNPSVLSNVKIDIMNLKSINDDFDNKLLYLLAIYNYCSKDIKPYFHFILEKQDFKKNIVILNIFSNYHLVEFYDLKTYILNIEYIKELFEESYNSLIKKFIKHLDDYINYFAIDIEKYINTFYLELSPIIESKIEETISENIWDKIVETVRLYEDTFEYSITEDGCEVKDMEEIIETVTNKLIPHVAAEIDAEISNYSFNNIKFENLYVEAVNCFERSDIEECIYDAIYNKIHKSKNKENDENYSIKDVFSQEYDLDLTC